MCAHLEMHTPRNNICGDHAVFRPEDLFAQMSGFAERGTRLNSFPNFMKNQKNAIASSSQSRGIEGYVYDGVDGGQMAFWECRIDGKSDEHVHNFDEYFVIVEGQYTLILNNQRRLLKAGDEFLIPTGTKHAGEFTAGTRTIHAFGGRRAERVATDR